MIQLLCDDCRKPVDPSSDVFFSVDRLEICVNGRRGQIPNLIFCSKAHFVSWIQKNAEPPSIISAQGMNIQPGPLG